jgi:hypothetical protein
MDMKPADLSTAGQTKLDDLSRPAETLLAVGRSVVVHQHLSRGRGGQ